MKTKRYFTTLGFCLFFLSFICQNPLNEIPINSAVPLSSYKMKDVSGKEMSLNDLKKSKGLLVIFSCNTCPYVKLSESRIKEYSDFCILNEIGCVLINSNVAQRNAEDSFDEMVKYHANQKLKCAYLIDDKSQLANSFGAGRTPQCFLFNANSLIYKGAIDDNIKTQSAITVFYLKDALSAMLNNQQPKIQETKAIGCSIKRSE